MRNINSQWPTVDIFKLMTDSNLQNWWLHEYHCRLLPAVEGSRPSKSSSVLWVNNKYRVL